MLRTIAIPTTNDFVLSLPNELLNKKVEFIAFPIEEEPVPKKTKKRFGRGLFKGKMTMADDFNAPLDDMKEYMERKFARSSKLEAQKKRR